MRRDQTNHVTDTTPAHGLSAGGDGDAAANAAAIDIESRLRGAGLRPTRQRIAIGDLLFSEGDRHVSAEMIYEEACAHGLKMSLATVYNTLHQFQRAGLVREIAIDGSRSYFDTNTSNHNHFLLEDGSGLIDIPGDEIRVSGVPQPPAGMRITHIDVVVRLAPIEMPEDGHAPSAAADEG